MNKLIVFACLLAVCYGASVPAKQRDLSRRPIFSNGRIVGGEQTDISEVPYQVAMEDDHFQFCGGAIISETYILTSALCTLTFTTGNVSIRTGSSTRGEGGTVIQVKKVNVSPHFDVATQSNNVAVLELDQPISLSDKSAIISLTEDEPQAGDQVLASGWGFLAIGGEQPSSLQSVVLPVVDRAECKKAYRPFEDINESMICAGAEGKSSCGRDYGGPLVLNGKLVGIASWGRSCGTDSRPAVFTNIANKEVRDFIRATTNV